MIWSRMTLMRASMGMRSSAKLQPTQPWRRAVADNGLCLMMAEGGKAKFRFDERISF